MGDTNFSQNGLLTDERRAEITSLAKQHYNSHVKGQEFHQDVRRFGTEEEGAILCQNDPLTSDIIASILEEKPEEMQITKELGKHQIEHITGPATQSKGSIDALLHNAASARKHIQSSAQDQGAVYVPIGLVPNVSAELVTDEIITNGPRYKIAAEYARLKGGKSTITTLDDKIVLTGLGGLTLINSTHIHLQALSAKDAVNLFNYSQMIAPIMLALSTNSGVFDKQHLQYASQQIKMFEEAISPNGDRPRCGLHPGYIKSTDDYFEYAMQFPPIFDPGDGNGLSEENKAFNLTVGYYHPWAKLRTEGEHFRVELRSINVQPSTKEDFALVQAYILGVQALMENQELLPFELVQENFENAVRYGIDAKMHWDCGYGKVGEYSAAQVAHKMIWSAKKYGMGRDLLTDSEDELFELLFARTNQTMTPGKKFAKAVEQRGFDFAFRDYTAHAVRDIPYVKNHPLKQVA